MGSMQQNGLRNGCVSLNHSSSSHPPSLNPAWIHLIFTAVGSYMLTITNISVHNFFFMQVIRVVLLFLWLIEQGILLIP